MKKLDLKLKRELEIIKNWMELKQDKWPGLAHPTPWVETTYPRIYPYGIEHGDLAMIRTYEGRDLFSISIHLELDKIGLPAKILWLWLDPLQVTTQGYIEYLTNKITRLANRHDVRFDFYSIRPVEDKSFSELVIDFILAYLQVYDKGQLGAAWV